MFMKRCWVLGKGGRHLLPAQAIKELYQQGRAQQLNLGLVEKMIRCLGIYPVGSLIELNTGERGIVIAVNPGKALQPVVYLLWDQTHQRYATPVTVDLAAPEAEAPIRMICEVLDPEAEGYEIAAYFQKVTAPNAYPWLSLYARHADRGRRHTGAAPGASSWHMYGGPCGPHSILKYGGRTPPWME